MIESKLLQSVKPILLVLITAAAAGAFAQIPGRYTGEPGLYAPVIDSALVRRCGDWQEAYFRYGAARHLITHQDGAALEYTFRGTGLVLLLDNHHTPEYREPNLGRLVVTVDEREPVVVFPQHCALEVTVARDLRPGKHNLRIEHRVSRGLSGCRITGFRPFSGPGGDLEFTLHGEENTFLVNARAVLKRQGRLVRSTLVRNRFNGKCSLAGLAPGDGYELEISAMGWEKIKIGGLSIRHGESTVLDPVYLKRDERAPNRRYTKFPIHWPRLGHPVVRRPGETFRVRVACHLNELESVILRKCQGPAVISRRAPFLEHRELVFYYDHEITVSIPRDTPPGLYDLVLLIRNPNTAQDFSTIAPQSVYLVEEFPRDPVFFTFGHLDTSGQFQSEYLRRMAEMANLFAPDMVLVSNEVNPAYVSGALTVLQMPYLVNFGNHQVPGNQYWYGDPVGITDFGSDLAVLNFGLQWHENLSKAHALLTARKDVPVKVINAYEQNAPVKDFLDRYGVAMLHDGHGTGKKVMEIGSTPTVRVGKVNAYSFRVVRFRNRRVASCTYLGDEVAPYPFPREVPAPVRADFQPANDGSHSTVTATVTNDLEEDIPRGRVTFVLPSAQYRVDRGLVESARASDDGRYVVLSVRADFPARQSVSITVRPEGR